MTDRATCSALAVSVVIPVHNEADNIAPLLAEVAAALSGRLVFEAVMVDDGSTDETPARLIEAMAAWPWVRTILLTQACGKAAAVRTGARHAAYEVMAIMDGDGQNDPAYLAPMVEALAAAGPAAGMVNSQRVGRQDTTSKRLQSKLANAVRKAILNDGTRDTGSGLKVIRTRLFLDLPFFDGLHRFLPALTAREGLAVLQHDVIDRPRMHGVSKYGLWNRLWVGILDLFGVWWLIRRRKRVPAATEVKP